MEKQIEFYKNKLQYEIDPSDLYEALNNGEKIVVVDARKAYAYQEEHIPGAINIPHREMSAENVKKLNKDVLYVCYCDGIGCNASTKGSLNLTQLGFNVKELLGGLEWWKKDGYATEGIKETKGQIITCAC